MDITSQQPANDEQRLPVIVLEHLDNDTYRGVLALENTRGLVESICTAIGHRAVEPEQVHDYIQLLIDKQPGHVHNNTMLVKLSNYDILDSAEASIHAAFDIADQAIMVLYSKSQWHSGLINAGHQGTLSLEPINTFFDVPVSEAYRNTLPSIDVLKDVAKGDDDILERAITLSLSITPQWEVDYEEHPVLTTLCQWWNENCPPASSHARTISAYIYDEGKGVFISGDYEEPVVQVEAILKSKSVTIFTYMGLTVAIEFLKGKADNRYIDNWATTYLADGEVHWKMRCKLEYINFSERGVRSLKHVHALATKLNEGS